MKNAVILLAAGKGTRMGPTIADKMLIPINGKPLFAYSLESFISTETTQHISITYRDTEQKTQMQEWVETNLPSCNDIQWINGGQRRQDSVYNALQSIPNTIDYVFIHDCARPLIKKETIEKLNQALIKEDATALAHRVTDTIKQVKNHALKDLKRDTLWAMETPQAFKRELIIEAYNKVQNDELTITDDVAALEHIGVSTKLVESDNPNTKVTHINDILLIKYFLNHEKTPTI